jgi:hypothetical protein
MRRRALLAVLGSSTALGTAGCLGDSMASDAEQSDSPTSDPTIAEDPTTVTDDRVTGDRPTDLDSLGAPPAESDCPIRDPDSTVRVVCTPVGGTPPAGTGLTASAESVTLPEDTIAFTLRNTTDTRLDTNFYGWSLWKRTDDDWLHIAPEFYPQPMMSLAPGESHRWTLTVGAETQDAGNSGTSEIEVGDLDAGEYAFGTDGWFASADHEHKTAFAVRFRAEK